MSKMSQMHAELTQEAYENGFETLEEYLADQERTKAHEAWLKEKEVQLERLDAAVGYLEMIKETEVAKIVKDAVNFIKKGEQ